MIATLRVAWSNGEGKVGVVGKLIPGHRDVSEPWIREGETTSWCAEAIESGHIGAAGTLTLRTSGGDKGQRSSLRLDPVELGHELDEITTLGEVDCNHRRESPQLLVARLDSGSKVS